MLDSILLTVIYTLSWFVVLAMALMVVGSFLQYRGLQQKKTRALVGLSMIVVLWLAAIGFVIAQPYSGTSTRIALLFLLTFITTTMQLVNQWTIATMYKQVQYTIRWVLTGLFAVYALIVISFLIYVRLKYF